MSAGAGEPRVVLDVQATQSVMYGGRGIARYVALQAHYNAQMGQLLGDAREAAVLSMTTGAQDNRISPVNPAQVDH